MTIQEIASAWMPILVPTLGFVFVVGRAKAILDHHEKQLEKHDQVIDGLIRRVNDINTEFTFMKGWLSRMS